MYLDVAQDVSLSKKQLNPREVARRIKKTRVSAGRLWCHSHSIVLLGVPLLALSHLHYAVRLLGPLCCLVIAGGLSGIPCQLGFLLGLLLGSPSLLRLYGALAAAWCPSSLVLVCSGFLGLLWFTLVHSG